MLKITATRASALGTAREPIDKRQRMVDGALKKNQYRQDALIEVLHTVQSIYGYLTDEHLWYVAQQLKLPPSQVYGVATFYNFFTLKPPGEHTVVVCHGTACFIKDSRAITAALEQRFGIKPGETTSDGQLSLSIARCLGSCSLAPTAIVDGVVHGRTTPDTFVALVEAAISQNESKELTSKADGMP